MMEINIPGLKPLRLTHLVLDFNGTLARDGKAMEGVRQRLENLARELEIHVLTADTFGTVEEAMAGIRAERLSYRAPLRRKPRLNMSTSWGGTVSLRSATAGTTG